MPKTFSTRLNDFQYKMSNVVQRYPVEEFPSYKRDNAARPCTCYNNSKELTNKFIARFYKQKHAKITRLD